MDARQKIRKEDVDTVGGRRFLGLARFTKGSQGVVRDITISSTTQGAQKEVKQPMKGNVRVAQVEVATEFLIPSGIWLSAWPVKHDVAVQERCTRCIPFELAPLWPPSCLVICFPVASRVSEE